MKKVRNCLFVLLYFVMLLVFVRAVGFNGLYGQDAHEYYRYSSTLLNWLNTGQHPGDYFWPVWYPLMGALVAYVTHLPVLVGLQLVSILWLCIIVWVALRWVQPYNQMVTIAVFIGLGLSPLLLRSGLVVMADTMSIAATMLALLCFKNYDAKPQQQYVLGFAVFGALAVMARYASAVVLLPAAVYMAYGILVNRQWLSIAGALLLALLVCVPHIVLRHNAPLAFVKHEWVTSWSVLNFVSSHFVTPDGTQYYKLPNLLFVFGGLLHPTFGLLLLPAIYLAVRRRALTTVNTLLLITMMLYGLFLAGIPFQNKRFMLAILPVVVLVSFPAFATPSIRFSRAAKWLVVSLVIVLQLMLVAVYFEEVYRRNKLEQQLAALVKQQPQPVLYTFDVDMAIASYDTGKQMRNLWAQRYDTFETGALVLFNPDKFAVQWQGRNPMLNWQHLKNNYVLAPVAATPEGWQLLYIEKQK